MCAWVRGCAGAWVRRRVGRSAVAGSADMLPNLPNLPNLPSLPSLPSLSNLSNSPVSTTSAHCANHFKSKWDRLRDSIAKRQPRDPIAKRQPCDPTDASDPHYRCCRGPYPEDVADTRFDADADADAKPSEPAFRKGDRVLVVDCSSARDAWSAGVVTDHEIEFDELTGTERFRYVGEAVSQDGVVSVFSAYADGLARA